MKVTFTTRTSKRRKPGDPTEVFTVHEKGGDASLVAIVPHEPGAETSVADTRQASVAGGITKPSSEPSALVSPYKHTGAAVWIVMPDAGQRFPPMVHCKRCGRDVRGFYALVSPDDEHEPVEHVLPYPHEH